MLYNLASIPGKLRYALPAGGLNLRHRAGISGRTHQPWWPGTPPHAMWPARRQSAIARLCPTPTISVMWSAMIPLSPPPSPPLSVALRARHDGWTPERQQRFLAALVALRSITAAAAVVGLSVRSAYNLRDHPAAAAFRAAWEAALTQPVVASKPSRLDQALGRETVTRLRPGLGRGFGGSGAYTIDRPVAARVLVRLLARAEANVTKAQKRAES